MKEIVCDMTHRFKIFFIMFVGYTFFYFTRKSLIFVSPIMIDEMHISLSEFGTINTVFYVTYAISKFISGIISDRSNSIYIMAYGLMCTGLLNILIALFSFNVNFILVFWMLNAFFQSWGWPPITKLLSYLYTKKERGMWWSIYSLSHNLGGAIIPIIISLLSISYGWKFSIEFIGLVSICVSIFLVKMTSKYLNFNKKSYNLYRKDNTEKYSIIKILCEHKILLLSLSYFFLYVIKTSINDWTILFLVNQRKYNLMSAGIGIFYFEISGIFGMLFSGWITDKFFDGNRSIYTFFSSIILIFLFIIFWNIPAGYRFLDYLVLSFLGFLVFGQQMLIGLIASEFVNKNAVCTANGFVSCWAYIGAAMTGYPFGLVINLSWNIYFFIIIGSLMLLTVILLIILLINFLK